MTQVSPRLEELKWCGTCPRAAAASGENSGAAPSPTTRSQQSQDSPRVLGTWARPVDGLPRSNSKSEKGLFWAWKTRTTLSLKDGRVRGKGAFCFSFYPPVKPASLLRRKGDNVLHPTSVPWFQQPLTRFPLRGQMWENKKIIPSIGKGALKSPTVNVQLSLSAFVWVGDHLGLESSIVF